MLSGTASPGVSWSWNSGTTYRSLTEIAFAMTGTRWSGPRFFGVRRETPA
jgi:hypothetical protein